MKPITKIKLQDIIEHIVEDEAELRNEDPNHDSLDTLETIKDTFSEVTNIRELISVLEDYGYSQIDAYDMVLDMLIEYDRGY